MAVVNFRPEAVEEVLAAHAWYLARSRRVAARLFRELDAAVERIAADPSSLPLYDVENRFLKLRTLPYLFVFRATEGEAEVLAFAHLHRRPGYWRER